MSPYKQHLWPRIVRVKTRDYKPRIGPAWTLFKIEGQTVRNKCLYYDSFAGFNKSNVVVDRLCNLVRQL
jgi:hypothetical protein